MYFFEKQKIHSEKKYRVAILQIRGDDAGNYFSILEFKADPMKAIITRNMVVTNAKGEAEEFTKSDTAIEVDADTYRRLNRAGAAIVDLEGNDAVSGSGVGTLGVAEMTVASDGDGKPGVGGGVEVLEGKDTEAVDDVDADFSDADDADADADAEDLNKLTKAELTAKAEDLEIDVDPKWTKAEIIEAIEAKKAGSAE